MKPSLAAVALAALIALSGCSATGPAASVVTADDMLTVCQEKVATWAGVAVIMVTGHDLNDQNPSGKAWDFEGDFPGGTWKCGGPAGRTDPAQVMVWPEAGAMQDITNGGTPLPTQPSASDPTPAAPAKPDPITALAALVSAAGSASSECLVGMQTLANTSFDAPESVQNAAVLTSLQKCRGAGEYIIAARQYPDSWGMMPGSIDGQSALFIIQAACSLPDGPATAPCKDATDHGVLAP